MKKHFPAALRHTRHALGLSIAGLAATTAISAATIRHAMTGRHLRRDTLHQLLTALPEPHHSRLLKAWTIDQLGPHANKLAIIPVDQPQQLNTPNGSKLSIKIIEYVI